MGEEIAWRLQAGRRRGGRSMRWSSAIHCLVVAVHERRKTLDSFYKSSMARRMGGERGSWGEIGGLAGG